MKRALIVGINYVGTGNDLNGCVNDATNMSSFLQRRDFTEISVLLEKDATTAKIKAGLEWLIAGAAPGDTIVFHYSGHGSQLPSKVEKDGFEEIICPIDLNWTTRVITDDHLRAVFDKVPNGVNTTLILDCCHSGTALDQDESLQVSRDLVAPIVEAGGRYLPPPEKIAAKLEDRELVQWSTEKDVNASALLIAGCRSNQTSADAFIDGIYQGAATFSILRSAEKNPKITYRELINEMNDFMAAGGYTQRPELDGFSGLYDEIFVQPFGSADEPDVPAMVPIEPAPTPVIHEVVPAQEPTAQPPAQVEPPKSSTKVLIVLAALVAIIVFAIF